MGRLQGHKKIPFALAFAGTAGLLVSGGESDKEVKVWDYHIASQVSDFVHAKYITAVACNREGTYSVVADKSQNVYCGKISELENSRLFASAGGRVNSLAFCPKGQLLAGAGGIERITSEVNVWEIPSGNRVASLRGHSDWVLWVGFDATGSRMASGSYGEICLWDTESWQLLTTLKRPNTERFSTVAFTFTSDKDVFISGAWSHEQYKHEVRDESGKLLGWNMTSKGSVQFWDLKSGELSDCFEAHDNALYCLDYCDNTDLLATGGADGAVKIWKLDP